MTKVRFTFVDIQGNPLPLMEFKLIVRRASFNIEDVGVTLPEELTVTTDVTGQVIVDLWPLKTAYRIQVAEEYEELCGKLNWSFYVPHTNEIVEAQTLFLVPPPNNLPWDEEAMGKITQAVIDSKDSAEASEASAVRAENAAQSIEGDADRAEAARDAAEASKNAAAGSAQSAANSAAASGQSATDALASKNAAANSANAANNSAVSASNDAGRAAASEAAALASKNAAAGSATAASGSATTATNAANSATASKDAAATSATTASTKAGEASTSASNALTQANRAKTEADRAVAATDNKQDKNANLTAMSGLAGATDRLPYFTGVGALSLAAFTAKARELVSQPSAAGLRGVIFDTALPISQGGTSAVTPYQARINLELGSIATLDQSVYPKKLDTGVGTASAPDAQGYDSPGNAQGGGFYTIGGGSSSSGINYASMLRVPYRGAYEAQMYFPMGLSSSKMFFRVAIGGSGGNFGVAHEVLHTGNATKDPSVETGIMSLAIVSGFTICKYLNGQCHISGLLPATPSIGSAAFTLVTATIPTAVLAGRSAAIHVQINPTQSNDMYGVATAYENEAINGFVSSIGYVVRNGNIAQTFGARVSIWGTWK